MSRRFGVTRVSITLRMEASASYEMLKLSLLMWAGSFIFQCQVLCTRLYGVTSHKTVIFTVIAFITWIHTRGWHVFFFFFFFFFFFSRWTSFNWRFWSSQRHPSTLLYPGHRLTSFWSSFDQDPVWCCPPIYAWVFLLVSWLRDSI